MRFNKLWADMWQILNFITDTGNLSIVNLLRVRAGNQDLINWSMSWEAEKETSFLPSKVNSLAFINIVGSNVIIQSLDQTILCHIPVNGKFKFFSVSSLNCFDLGRHSNYSCNWSTWLSWQASAYHGTHYFFFFFWEVFLAEVKIWMNRSCSHNATKHG